MTEVIGLLHDLLAFSLSIEAGLSDFFHACGTWDEDSQRQRAQEFGDRLDEVRHAERHNIRSPHYTSRFLIMRIFMNENASNI